MVAVNEWLLIGQKYAELNCLGLRAWCCEPMSNGWGGGGRRQGSSLSKMQKGFIKAGFTRANVLVNTVSS